jgi:hypothetical protein
MKCPHCNIGIRLEIENLATYPLKQTSGDKRIGIELSHGFCPECNELIVILKRGEYAFVESEYELKSIQEESFLYPKCFQKVVDPLVPDYYRNAFNEANAVLSISPKASAALSRRLLQSLLRDEYQIIDKDLVKQIEKFIERHDIPSDVSQAVDAIRNIGNFAAHPNKYKNTGEIVDVEVGEAEWLIEVLEALFDVKFIQPQQAQERKNKLNEKLASLGKPPMKN